MAASTPFMGGARPLRAGTSLASSSCRALGAAAPGRLRLPSQKWYARQRPGLRPSAFSGRSFAHFASGSRPLRFACVLRPLRRGAPAACSGPLGSGRRSLARPLVRRFAAPRALAGPDCLRPRSRVAAGSLFGRPCFARPWALCSAWPRGFLSPRPFGLRGLSSSLRSSAAAPAPGPLAALRPPFFGLWPRGLLAARVLASACWAALAVLPGVLPRCLGFAGSRWLCCAALAPAGARCSAAPRRAPFSPAPLPSPPPPLGTPGRRKAQRVGFAPRSVGRASRAPLAAPPGGLIARPLR